jgi:hypothetical protein
MIQIDFSRLSEFKRNSTVESPARISPTVILSNSDERPSLPKNRNYSICKISIYGKKPNNIGAICWWILKHLVKRGGLYHLTFIITFEGGLFAFRFRYYPGTSVFFYANCMLVFGKYGNLIDSTIDVADDIIKQIDEKTNLKIFYCRFDDYKTLKNYERSHYRSEWRAVIIPKEFFEVSEDSKIVEIGAYDERTKVLPRCSKRAAERIDDSSGSAKRLRTSDE